MSFRNHHTASELGLIIYLRSLVIILQRKLVKVSIISIITGYNVAWISPTLEKLESADSPIGVTLSSVRNKNVHFYQIIFKTIIHF